MIVPKVLHNNDNKQQHHLNDCPQGEDEVNCEGRPALNLTQVGNQTFSFQTHCWEGLLYK